MSESENIDQRPEFLKEKYKTVEDQARAYIELEKKFGGFSGAPEEYKIPEAVSKDNRLVKLLTEKGKEFNMSQQAFESLVTEYTSRKASDRDAFKQSLEALDPVKKQTVSEVINYLKNNLSESEAERISSMMRSVDDVYLFDKLRKTVNPATNPPQTFVKEEHAPPTLNEYLKTVDTSRLEGPTADMNYRQEVDRMLAKYTQ